MDQAWAAFGPVARFLGMMAALQGRPDEAAGLFARAVELAAAWGSPGWELRAIVDWLASGAPAARRDLLVARGLVLAARARAALPWRLSCRRADTTTP